MCRRLITIPGVGRVVALTYRATVDIPARFRKSKAVRAVFGLTCSKYQSGEIERSGRISRCGDEMMRVMLYEAAQSMLRSKKWSWLKAWAMQIARRRGTAISRHALRSADCATGDQGSPRLVSCGRRRAWTFGGLGAKYRWSNRSRNRQSGGGHGHRFRAPVRVLQPSTKRCRNGAQHSSTGVAACRRMSGSIIAWPQGGIVTT